MWLVPVGLTLLVFRKFFFEGAIPIPADILTGAYYPWLDNFRIPVKNPLPSDVFSIIYPWRILGMNIMKTGHLPLWDDTILLGVPLFANFQAALANPVNIFFFVLDNLTAWALQVILQIPLLILTTYLFLRNLKLSRRASLFGGLLFAFSGYVLVWLQYNTIVYTLIYFPLLLLLVDKIVAKPKIIYGFLFGLFLALQIFSGYPLTSIYTLAAAGLYFLWRHFENKTDFLKKSGLLFLGVMSGLALAAVQILPAKELSDLSIRQFDTTAVAANVKYLPFGKLVSFFAPDYFGNPATANIWGVGGYDNFAFNIAAVGIFFFMLALVTRVAFRKRNAVFLIFILLAIAWATKNPISQFLEGISAASANTRVLFVVSFTASVLSALGFDWVSQNKTKLWQKAVPVIGYGILVAGTLLGYRFFQNMKETLSLIDVWDPLITESGRVGIVLLIEDFAKQMLDLNTAFRNLAIPAFVVLLAFFVVFIKNKTILFIFTVGLLTLSVGTSFDKYLSFTKKEWVFPETQAIDKLVNQTGEHRFEKEKAEILPQNTWSAYGLKSSSGQFTHTPLSTARYLNLINTKALKDEVLSRYSYIEATKSPLFDTLDIDYFAALNHDVKKSVPSKGGRPFPWIIPNDFEEVSNIDTVRIYKNTGNLGSSWLPEEIVCEKDIKVIAEKLIAEDYTPATKVFVDCDSPGHYKIFSRANYPGWKAFVEGQEREIKTANIALMAVPVEDGQEKVEFVYRPQSFATGAKISLATVGLWGLYLVKRRFIA